MFGFIYRWILNLLSRQNGSDSSESHSPSYQSPPSLSDSESSTKKQGDTGVNVHDRIMTMLRAEEGVRFKPYKDSLGYLTIGVGHLMDKRKGGSLPDWAKRELDEYGQLSNDAVNRLLETDLLEVTRQLDAKLPWARSLDPVRYCVLVDMCFQMGVNGLLGFKNTLRYIENGNYEQAAVNMGKSLWAKQTPNRAARRIHEMKTGVPHKYE